MMMDSDRLSVYVTGSAEEEQEVLLYIYFYYRVYEDQKGEFKGK